MHRFLNAIGGYVRHVDSYSLGAGRVLMPHVVATMDWLLAWHQGWDVLAEHTRLLVSFGGVPVKNAQVGAGGASHHHARAGLARLAASGCRFVSFSPVRSGFEVDGATPEWIPIRPNTDTAVMLSLACETILAGRLARLSARPYRRRRQGCRLGCRDCRRARRAAASAGRRARRGAQPGERRVVAAACRPRRYEDCPGHPTWIAPVEWLCAPGTARHPLHMLSDQPYTKLHSQLDFSTYSLAGKVAGREPVLIHPVDAAGRGIRDGDVVRLYNDRGACLAGAVLTDAIRPGVVKLSTGAWWDPDAPGEPGALDRHGNPNVLTRDAGASCLSQGCTAQTCLVQLERWLGLAPPVAAWHGCC